MADYNSSYTGAQIDAAVGAVANKADDNAVVHDTGNETIGGVKTFSSFPVTPSTVPTANYQVANKKYIDDKVKTDVPVGAKFTDTVYTHPDTHSISEVDGLQAALNDKVDDSQVLTNVPANAVFTDTVYTHPATHAASMIEESSSRRFVSDAEKSTWNSKAAETHSHTKSQITDFPSTMPPSAHTHEQSDVTGLGTALSAKADSSHTHTPSTVGLGNVDNAKQMPIAGGTFTGIVTAQSNTSYLTRQIRNFVLSTADPSGGSNGDVWIKWG